MPRQGGNKNDSVHDPGCGYSPRVLECSSLLKVYNYQCRHRSCWICLSQSRQQLSKPAHNLQILLASAFQPFKPLDNLSLILTMAAAVEAIGVLSGLLGIVQFGIDNFKTDPQPGSTIKVAVALDGANGGTDNAGGDLPDM